MREVLFQKVQRLLEETKYLEDNKERFLGQMQNSLDVKKIVERSVFRLYFYALKWLWI